jgi:hypothetical protein
LDKEEAAAEEERETQEEQEMEEYVEGDEEEDSEEEVRGAQEERAECWAACSWEMGMGIGRVRRVGTRHSAATTRHQPPSNPAALVLCALTQRAVIATTVGRSLVRCVRGLWRVSRGSCPNHTQHDLAKG